MLHTAVQLSSDSEVFTVSDMPSLSLSSNRTTTLKKIATREKNY